MSQAQIAPVTAQELAAHVEATQQIHDQGVRDLLGDDYENRRPTRILAIEGRKYAKIIKSRGPSDRSVHHFVNMETGEILKAANWKSPAKHARGNIRQANLAEALQTFGARYLR